MRTFRIVLLVLGAVALAGYVLFVFDLLNHWIRDGESFGQILAHTEIYLFLFFVAGFVLLKKNELIAGIIWIVWHVLQWALVLWVWDDGEVTLLMGFPVFIIGILLVVYSIRMKSRMSSG